MHYFEQAAEMLIAILTLIDVADTAVKIGFSALIQADAAKESVMKGPPELIAALKRAYRATESKPEETTTPESYQAVNDRMMSRTDPDAPVIRRGGGDSRPRYQHHRAIDDHKGVITAVESTPGSIAERPRRPRVSFRGRY